MSIQGQALEKKSTQSTDLQGKNQASDKAVNASQSGSHHEQAEQGTGRAPINSESSRGDIAVLQSHLQQLKYLSNGGTDGSYGPGTTAAVTKYQKDNGLEPTGIADEKTLNSIDEKIAAIRDNNTKLERGSKEKSRVMQLQFKLVDLGYNTNGIDGDYGDGTFNAVKKFQQDNNLEPTGVADPDTLSLLESKASFSTNSASSALGDQQFGSAQEKYIAYLQHYEGYLEKNNAADLNEKTTGAGSDNFTRFNRDYAVQTSDSYMKSAYWCNMFVDSVLMEAFGADNAVRMMGGESALCSATASNMAKLEVNKKSDKLKNSLGLFQQPEVGDFILYKGSDGGICHIGVVVEVNVGGNSKKFRTIEGNTSSNNAAERNGGAVAYKDRTVGASNIAGFARPDWSVVEDCVNDATASTLHRAEDQAKQDIAAQEEKQAEEIKAPAVPAQDNGVETADNTPAAEEKQSGVDLAHGATSELLARGESATNKAGFANDPYGTFNYYHGSSLGSSYYGMIDGKLISQHTLGYLKKLSKSETTLNISYYDGDAPQTKTGRLFALGKYQIVPDTRNGAQTSLGLTDDTVFSNEVQDKMFTEYLITDKKSRGAIINYLTGKSDDIDAAARAIAQEWASVGIKPGTNGATRVGGSSGMTSYYDGDGVNAASISYFEICEALKADRAAVASGGVATHTIAEPTSVNSSSEASHTNTDASSNPSAQQTSPQDQAANLPILKKGSSGPDVVKLQNLLIEAGYSLAPYGADGSFGGTTRKAVVKFQADHQLDPDGSVGPLTWAALLGNPAPVTETTKPAETTTVTTDTGNTDTPSESDNSGNSDAPAGNQSLDEVESLYTDTGTITYNTNPGEKAVKVLQHYLNKYINDFGAAKNELKLSTGKLDEDGSFGWRSFQALMYFQFSRGLWESGFTHGKAIDGKCGPKTWAALRNGASKVHDLDKGVGYKDGAEAAVPDGDIGETGHRISSSGASKYKEMKAAAANDGVSLSACSSFRSLTTSGTTNALGERHSGCIELYADYRLHSGINNGNEAATPGNSNHCFGNAIDFNGIPKDPTSAVGNTKFEWLKAHAATYSFSNYKPEGWHWNYNP